MKSSLLIVLSTALLSSVTALAADFNPPVAGYTVRDDRDVTDAPMSMSKADIIRPGVIRLTTNKGTFDVAFSPSDRAVKFMAALDTWTKNTDHMYWDYRIALQLNARQADGTIPASRLFFTDSAVHSVTAPPLVSMAWADKMAQFQKRETELLTGMYGTTFWNTDYWHKYRDWEGGAGVYDQGTYFSQVSGKYDVDATKDKLASELNMGAAAE